MTQPSDPKTAAALQQLIVRFPTPLPRTELPDGLGAANGSAAALEAAAGHLSLRFAYKLEDGLDGLYKSTFKGGMGQQGRGRDWGFPVWELGLAQRAG